MRWRQTLVLFVLVVALGAYISIFEMRSPSTDEWRSAKQRLYPKLDSEDISRLEILNTHGEVKLERRGEGWRMTYPADAPASYAVADEITRALEYCRPNRLWNSGEGGFSVPEGSGLEQPEVVVKFKALGEIHEIQFGNATPFGPRVYFRELPSRSAGVFADAFRDLFSHPAVHYRDRTVFDFLPHKVTELRLVGTWGDFVAGLQPEGWLITSPLRYPAARFYIDQWVRDLRALRVEEFVADEVTDYIPYDLDAPEARFEIVVAGLKQPLVLEVGGKVPGEEEDLRYCRLGQRDAVVTVKVPAALLRPEVRDFADARLLSYAVPQVEELRLRSLAGELVLKGRKLPTGAREWRLVQPVNASADVSVVKAFLGKLTERRVLEILPLAGDADLAKYGLDEPHWVMALKLEGEPDPIVWELGDRLQNGGRYARQPSMQAILVLDNYLDRELEKHPSEWRDRRLSSVDTSLIQSIEIEVRGESKILGPADKGWAELLQGLPELTWISVLKEELPADAPQLGLDKPVLVLRLLDPQGRILDEISFSGKLLAKRLVPVSNGGHEAYEIPELHLETLLSLIE
ncbi:MAG: DUF4340 domain-containing protein [Candidatus Omnitrophica bacterium]|nr:DUF4340 domain-containing protein [Candidatus Omnitrophota bacterium]